jgi:adenylylsulfate kinase
MRGTASHDRGLAVWFTGLSGAGKTTLCQALEPVLRTMGYSVHILDGEDIRRHLSRDLGFSKKDREEHAFRIGCIARSLVRQDVVVLVAAISPYRESRSRIRELIGDFLEVYVNAPIETCMRRDPKGLYARALTGEIQNFTGVSDPYEAPLEPDVQCNTERETQDESAAKVLAAICKAKRRTSAVLSQA